MQADTTWGEGRQGKEGVVPEAGPLCLRIPAAGTRPGTVARLCGCSKSSVWFPGDVFANNVCVSMNASLDYLRRPRVRCAICYLTPVTCDPKVACARLHESSSCVRHRAVPR